MTVCIKCHAELPPGAAYCPACGKKQAPEKRKALKRANGTGTVYKLEGRRRRPWVAAKNKTIIGYYERKTDALKALDKLAGKDITVKYNMTFSDVFEEWKAEHYRGLSDSGVRLYDLAYRAFEPLHNRKFRDLRTKDFQTVIDQHLDKSHSMLSKYKQLIMQMSKYAIREEIATTNFATYVQLPKAEQKEKETFSDEEVEALRKDGSETAMIVLMLIYTGMRIGELFNLKLEDYHETYVVGGEKTEAGKNRVIPIRPEGRPYFAYFVANAEDDRLISGYTGQKSVNNFRQKDYYPLLERLNIKRKSPHSTRHTYASWAVKSGMPPEVLQKILGHANYTTTANIYVHSDIDQLVKAVEKC